MPLAPSSLKDFVFSANAQPPATANAVQKKLPRDTAELVGAHVGGQSQNKWLQAE
jgi:hypothetical protein